MGRRVKKQYAKLSGKGRCDQLVAEIDRQLNKFRRMAPKVIGVDYGIEGSAEITGYARNDGTLLITGIDNWRHDIDLTPDSTTPPRS